MVGSFAALVVATFVWRGESFDIRECRVASHTKVVLHATLGRQPVVIPAHRVENAVTLHALIARDDVGVGVAKYVADVQRTRDGWRGGVDRIDLFATDPAVEAIDAVVLPNQAPFVFEAFDANFFWNHGPGQQV